MNGYYITQNNPTEKITLEPKEEILLNYMNLIELVLPRCKRVWCNVNNLTKLIVPIGCVHVSCAFNKLPELIIPKGCKQVHCYHNQLKELIIPQDCIIISCSSNNLHPIIINLLGSEDPVKIALANNLQLDNNLKNYKSICDHSLIF